MLENEAFFEIHGKFTAVVRCPWSEPIYVYDGPPFTAGHRGGSDFKIPFLIRFL